MQHGLDVCLAETKPAQQHTCDSSGTEGLKRLSRLWRPSSGSKNKATRRCIMGIGKTLTSCLRKSLAAMFFQAARPVAGDLEPSSTRTLASSRNYQFPDGRFVQASGLGLISYFLGYFR